MSDEYWTPEREALWERLDSIGYVVEKKLNQTRPSHRHIKLHTSAPNPNGIRADETPDGWYWGTPHTDIDEGAVAALLADHLEGEVEVQERPNGWEDGYWFVCDSDEVAP